MISASLFCVFDSLLAQAAANPGWVQLLLDIEPGKIIMLGIFGTGLVSAAGYAIASVIRAAHGSPEDSEELQQRITELETRVRLLEQRQRDTAGVS